MKKYSSIEQYRNVIKEVRLNHDYKGKDENGNPVYLHTTDYPTLTFRGTVKLHGTNAAVVKYTDKIEFQSRSNMLSLGSDNAGFMNYMHDKNLDFLFERFEFNDYIAVYGEWCGGNIQKGVAINGLPKMFVIFGIKVDDDWVELPSDLYNIEINIYNILQFPTYLIDIDFNNPELSQNALVNMTLKVEECCPVGQYFGVNGVGEGIVFTCVNNQKYKFKSKGEKHQSSNVKTLNSVDMDLLTSINDFVNYAVTENRLEQGISYLNENNIEVCNKNTKVFIDWVIGDVFKEEVETILINNLDEKKIKHAISVKARTWFLNYPLHKILSKSINEFISGFLNNEELLTKQ